MGAWCKRISAISGISTISGEVGTSTSSVQAVGRSALLRECGSALVGMGNGGRGKREREKERSTLNVERSTLKFGRGKSKVGDGRADTEGCRCDGWKENG